MNREDLSFALRAVLPHAGRSGPTAWVGIHVGAGEARVYATDDLTFGVARIATPPGGDTGTLWLSTKEATELERFVRPTLKAHKEETITWEARGQELHIGCDQGTKDGFQAVVFDLIEPQSTIEHYMRLIAEISKSATSIVMAADPALMSRFAAAKRSDGDRIWWHARQAIGLGGRPFVKWIGAVEDYFIGAIAGMSIENYQADPLASFSNPHKEQAA